MRTTLDIDDDVLEAAKELAKAEGKTAGQALSELARKALTTSSLRDAGFAETGQPSLGDDIWPTLPNRQGVLVTQAMVERIEEEIALEDGQAWDHEKNEPVRW